VEHHTRSAIPSHEKGGILSNLKCLFSLVRASQSVHLSFVHTAHTLGETRPNSMRDLCADSVCAQEFGTSGTGVCCALRVINTVTLLRSVAQKSITILLADRNSVQLANCMMQVASCKTLCNTKLGDADGKMATDQPGF